jgi:hypothetical protein
MRDQTLVSRSWQSRAFPNPFPGTQGRSPEATTLVALGSSGALRARIGKRDSGKRWFRNDNAVQRGRLVQGAASRWRFGMMAASIPYNYSYAAHCMLMNEWRFESLTNRRQRVGKSLQRER